MKNSFVKSFLYDQTDSAISLNVAAIAMQCDINPSINQLRISRFVKEIKEENHKTDLIFFGETITSHYHNKTEGYHKQIGETIPGPTTKLISELAKKNNVYICFGIAEIFNGQVYNTQILINTEGEILAQQRKKNLRSTAFEAGNEAASIVDIRGIKTGLVICADIRSKEALNIARTSEAELILLSNADWSDKWDTKNFAFRYLAKQYNAWIVTANRYGDEDDIFWDGHIEIVDPFGEIRMKGVAKEQYISYELKIDKTQARMKTRKVYNKVTLIYLVIKNLGIVSHYI